MARKIDPKPGDKYNMLTYVGDEGREPSAVNGTKKSCGCLLRAKGEAWHRGKRKRVQPRPKTMRLLVTIQVLDTDPGDMVQYAPESPSRAGKET